MHSYIVAKGDSLWIIAKRFGVSLESVIKANPQIKDPNKIRVGESVSIPLEEDGGDLLYKAQSGDTLWSIAEKFGAEFEDLIDANEEIVDADVIAVGQVIRVPVDEGRGRDVTRVGVNDGALYEVGKGETFYLIARRFRLDPDVLRKANPQVRKGEDLRAGVQLYLPGSYAARRGDTLRKVARLFDAEPSAVKALNRGDLDAPLRAGTKVMIPRRKNGDIALYVVERGDSLRRVAERYGVTVESILLVNGQLRNGERIYPGEKVRIPGPHLVRKGQTLFEIAALYGLPLSVLIDANRGVEPEALEVGQVIRVPVGKGASPGKRQDGPDVEYVARHGDTLGEIALLYHVSEEALRAANPEVEDEEVPAETVLRVPVGYVRCGGYTVREEDTLWRIAARYGISAAALIHANPRIDDEYDLIGGEVLLIPYRGDFDVMGGDF